MKLADVSSGVILGSRFRLVEILGRGSYGDVWLADALNNPQLPQQVALKIYHDQDRATKKLLEEATLAIGFKHERLVEVFGAERIDGLVAMWMEYVPGEALYQRIGDDSTPRPVPLDDVMSWLRDIAEGLAYLHTHEPPFVHGDLKLDNVLLNEHSEALLVDFGQSRTIDDRFVETNGIGAWPYLAPEVIGVGTDGRGVRCVGSDIYAFGVIAYRFLTGRFPRRTLSEAINLIPFPRPIELNSTIPAELDIMVWKCLEKRPENRYPNGASLLAAVQTVIAHLSKQHVEEATTVVPEPVRLPTPAEDLAVMARELLAEGKIEEVITKLEKALERMTTSPRVLIIYGEAAKRAGRLDAAREVYRRVVRWLQGNGSADVELRDPVENLADVNVKLKRYEEGVEGFAWLVERWPEKRWYRYRLGVAHGLAGQFGHSLAVLKKLAEEGPPSALIAAKIGVAYEQLKDTEQACQYYNEALMLDEYEPTALYHLARIRAIQGRHDRARAYLERLEKVDGYERSAAELAKMLGRQ